MGIKDFQVSLAESKAMIVRGYSLDVTGEGDLNIRDAKNTIVACFVRSSWSWVAPRAQIVINPQGIVEE